MGSVRATVEDTCGSKLAFTRRREDALAGQAPAQCVPNAATIMLPHKKRTLRVLWSPEERENYPPLLNC
jgi:hypothetical protein